jgi:hypothetical protein
MHRTVDSGEFLENVSGKASIPEAHVDYILNQ